MPNWKILSQYPCGCQVRQVHIPRSERYFIEYCPKHKATFDMYEALVKYGSALMFLKGDLRKLLGNMEYKALSQAYSNASKAIAKAEGRGS